MNEHSAVSTPAPRVLRWCVHLLVAALLALAATRAVVDARAAAGWIVAAAVVFGFVYAVGGASAGERGSRRATATWLGALAAAWLLLLALTPDAVWLAFGLQLLQLHLLSRRTGVVAVGLTMIAAIAGFAAHQQSFGPAMAIGPALGAAVAVAVVWGYQELYRESEQRRRLIDELTTTRADLAAAQHTAGVLAERDRLAREIHDTLAQGLSSIQLLLHAAERALPGAPETATDHIAAARQAAGDNLDEARRFVAALAPPALDGTTLAGALERLCRTTGVRHRLTARFSLRGEPIGLATAQEVALLRVAQSALSNTVQYAYAENVAVVLRYGADDVALSVTDDGIGFDAAAVPGPGPGTGGFGIPAMYARAHDLGGELTVETAPGDGTAVTLRLPLTEGTA
ncbi:sensor histidine kinase [Tsukamurella serpentis]